MANILNARWNISADDMSIPNAIDVHIYSAIGFRNLQLYVEYKWKLERILCGTGDEDTMRQNEIFQWLSLPLSVAIDWHSSSPILYFGFRQEFPFCAVHCNGIVNGNCDRDLCLCLYYLYDEDNRPHSWFRRRMVGSFVGFRYIGIWAHRFSTGHIFSSFQCRIFVSLLTEKTCSYVKRAWIVC